MGLVFSGLAVLGNKAHYMLAALNGSGVFSDDLMGPPDFDHVKEEPSYPSDLLILSMGEDRRKELTESMRADPPTKNVDPVTVLVFKKVRKLKEEDFHEILTTNPATEPKKDLVTSKFLCFDIPEFTEENPAIELAFPHRRLIDITEDILNAAPIYDEKSPAFFHTKDEAAVFFDIVLRPHLPPTGFIVDALCQKKHVDGDLEALVFSGAGQWFLKGISTRGSSSSWADREAPASVKPPTGSVVVVDMCAVSQFPVREGFVRYGAAAFFGKNRSPRGIWLAAEARMVTPGSADWQWAVWNFKCTLFYISFAPKHLVDVHWMTSNTLNIASRTTLEPTHPLRQLLTPFTHRSVTINRLAIVNLCADKGFITRIGCHTKPEIDEVLQAFAADFRYESFEKHIERMGDLPPGMLDALPIVHDGRRLVVVIQKFVNDSLAQFYGDGKQKVTDDADVVAFWELADRCAVIGGDKQGARRFGLPELSFDTLADYVTHFIFSVTALHELLGSQTMNCGLPTTQGLRVYNRKVYEDAGHGFQAPVADWCRSISITGATTTVPMPMLISEMRNVAKKYKDGEWYGKNPKLAKIHTTFANELDDLSDVIQADNAARKYVFGSFNPRRLEVSVSL